jgi:hypothetical protein
LTHSTTTKNILTLYQSEELENIRRLAQRGKAYNERSGDHDLDLFNEILSTVERIKNDNKEAQDSIAGH